MSVTLASNLIQMSCGTLVIYASEVALNSCNLLQRGRNTKVYGSIMISIKSEPVLLLETATQDFSQNAQTQNFP